MDVMAEGYGWQTIKISSGAVSGASLPVSFVVTQWIAKYFLDE